ncbi:hypothetical protein O1611_g5097 [Lasiodiplodia mahajangana]|uniref:Uncharacterized protein n=1 Tax=Lasiodiplodia mahajangana TaxID=1108764 RepID=A0ACC2JM04_9PEZI|nr:hypothetical protein O1611_g5097 [Lasiodiplodia mahajangana]
MSYPIDPDETDPYILHLASKNRYQIWMRGLKTGSKDHVDKKYILDITSSGAINHWESGTNTLTLSTELGEKRLIGGTRLIIFNPTQRVYVQHHVGIMYDIDPEFFRTVRWSGDSNGYWDEIYGGVPEFLVGGRPQHLNMGYGWSSVIRRHDSHNLVLVSAPYVSGDSPLVYRSDNETSTSFGSDRFLEEYLQAILQRDARFLSGVHKNPLILLLPTLNIHYMALYKALNDVDRDFRYGRSSREEKPKFVENAWDSLRMIKHDGMRPLNCIRQYDNDHNDGKLQHSEEYSILAEKFKCIEEQISRMEALARDYLQHHVAMFSLEESRASIKQAKVALEESKRTKLSI